MIGSQTKSNDKPAKSKSRKRQIAAYNYCVGFIDLLGQRDAVHGQGLLPQHQTKEDRDQLLNIVKNSVGSISKLQKDAESILRKYLRPNPKSPFRVMMPKELHPVLDSMGKARIKEQRWSDGMVFFVCLADEDIRCKMNGVFGLFSLLGALCLIGLGNRRPIRGAIEIAWGVELHPRELYGPAVARAYELESQVAQYPRIVIGPEALKFLQFHQANESSDLFSRCDSELAKLCLAMLILDIDGQAILHYLGDEFRNAITKALHPKFYTAALEFVLEQLQQHQANQNTKLAFRYSHLLDYFETYPTSKS